MTGLDDDGPRGHELEDTSVGVLAADVAPGQQAHMRVHAERGADERLHVA